MTDYTIPMIIGMTLAFALGAGLGGLWGRSQREQARPQVKPRRDFDKEPYTMDEVVRRLSPHGDRAGEWYCTSRQPKMAWRIDMVDAEGLIVRKLVHDMREHTVTEAPRPQQPENIRTLAQNIIKFNFRFLKDFDQSEWD